MMNYSTSSGQLLASALVLQLPGGLSGIDVSPPTSGFAELFVYDSEDSNIAGKKILSEVYVDAGHISVNHEYFRPVAINRGLYCVLVETGGIGSSYNIRFTLG